MKMTTEIFKQGESRNGGWSTEQFYILNEVLKCEKVFQKGWKSKAIGKDFSEEKIKKFLELKDKHLPEHDGILRDWMGHTIEL